MWIEEGPVVIIMDNRLKKKTNDLFTLDLDHLISYMIEKVCLYSIVLDSPIDCIDSKF